VSSFFSIVLIIVFTDATSNVYISGYVMEACLVLACASAGFLVWNWSPAKIFMGDVGSVFLGYAFAILSLQACSPF
ncbi:MAG: hypothetical protein ABGX11_03755, partial [Candidatus Poseidoniia archaeon]